MSGVRLEAKVHIVTAAVASAQNIVKCCNRCGLQVADIVLEPLASAEAVLHDDERELGVALIDIGGGTTDIALFVDGAIVHTSVLPLGGNHLTNDIAVGLRAPLEAAEKIKQKYGCALSSLMSPGDTIEVPSVGGRPPRIVPREDLVNVIMPRVEEIFDHVKKEIGRSGFEDLLASGVVLTGGSTILEGMTELAEEILGMSARRGIAKNIGGLVDVVRSPSYATGVGLVQYGAKLQRAAGGSGRGPQPDKNMWRKMRSWFKEAF
jgi:cell division protein FtsA